MRLSVVVRFALLHLALVLAVWAAVRAMTGTSIPGAPGTPGDGAIDAESAHTWPLFVAALASTGILAWRMVVRVRRPLHALADYSNALSADQAERPRPLDEEDEFQDAAYSAWRLWATMTERLGRLSQEKEELRTVLDSMAEGVMVTDTDGRIVLWNQAFARLFAPATVGSGGTEAALDGRLPIEVVRSAALQDAIEEARDARDSVSVDLELAGGRTFTVRIDRIAGIASRGHRPLLIVFHEISALRRAQRTRRDFLANASHELRTPIATITAAAETLESGELPVESHRFIEMIVRQSRRMSELVEKMLRLSELEAGFEPKAEVVALWPLVDDVFEAARTRLGQNAPELRNEVEPELAAWVDPVACEQMLTNLVDNACKHTPPGGTVTVRGRSQATAVELEVADTGQGISKEHLGRIFERFYRVDSGRSRDSGGTGLGLAIVRHLVLAHKGTITVESQVGKGTSFQIMLPEPIR